MTATSLFYWNEKHAKTQPRVIELSYSITGAKTCSPLVQGQDSYVFYDAITQADVDNYLGSSSDFNYLYWDATAMGADTFGGIVRMSGSPSTYAQGLQLVKMEANCASGTGGSTLVSRYANGATGMTASTLETACQISTLGNFGFKVDFGNTPDFDGLTSGLIWIRLFWISK